MLGRGDGFTRCCSTAWVRRTASTGRGPRSTRRACPLPGEGGEKTGPNPTDRGKRGSKRHLVVDRGGIPLAVEQSAASVHDSKMFKEAVDTVWPIHRPRGSPGKPRKRPKKLHAGKCYDFGRCRKALRKRGIIPRIARRSIESSEKLGRHRWVVERPLSWLNRYRRLKVRYERQADIHQAFLNLECALICWSYARGSVRRTWQCSGMACYEASSASLHPSLEQLVRASSFAFRSSARAGSARSWRLSSS